MREQLLYYAVKYNGEYKQIEKAIKDHEEYQIIKYPGKFITILDEKYPKQLLRLKYKPFVLFYEGDLSLLEKDYVSIVGSRNMSSYGKECIEYLEKHIHERYGFISGLALGCDAYSHEIALIENRPTIAVLGNGIDIAYPRCNAYLYERIKQNGLILSEYPYGTRPLSYHFPWRNRIVAALSNILIVVEAKIKSGTMITVNEALEIGNDIYCFPHNIFHEEGKGCHYMIESGANILYDASSISRL